MKNKFSPFFKSILTDFLFWFYIVGCIRYLVFRWFEFSFPIGYHLVGTFVLLLVFFIGGDSIGRNFFFQSRKTAGKWFLHFWGWFIVLGFLITFIVGWNVVEVKPIKFLTKFANAKNIVSGIFNPNFEILMPMLSSSILGSSEMSSMRQAPFPTSRTTSTSLFEFEEFLLPTTTTKSTYLVAIIANAVRHWNDNSSSCVVASRDRNSNTTMVVSKTGSSHHRQYSMHFRSSVGRQNKLARALFEKCNDIHVM